MNEATPLDALERFTQKIRHYGKRFALVGGLAVTVRSEPRFTRDVDLCVVVDNDDDAEQLAFELRAEGYEIGAIVEHEERGRLSIIRLRGPEGIVCDLLVASSGIEREVVERATLVEVKAGLTLPVARTEELIALKVLSSTDQRLQDLADFQRLIEYEPELDRHIVIDNLRRIEARGYHRGQDLEAKLQRMLETTASASSWLARGGKE